MLADSGAMRISSGLLALLVLTSLPHLCVLLRRIYYEGNVLTESLGLLCRYEADHVYALGTVYFMCAVIGVFAVGHFLQLRLWFPRTPVSSKTQAVLRSLSYRGFHFPALSWFSSSLGVVMVIIVGILFCSSKRSKAREKEATC